MMHTVANAIRNAGDDVNRESLREAMAATKDLPLVRGRANSALMKTAFPQWAVSLCS